MIFLALLIFTIGTTYAQTPDAVYDQYLDFNLARFQNESSKALLIGESLLPNVAKLPAKSQVLYYNGLAKLYEDSSQPDKAITYYELVVAAQPDYYVPHRALGYLYNEKAKEIYKQIQAGKGDAVAYKAAVMKALPHLEKAQACDPSDETLTLIKFLYNSIKDTAGLTSLPARLAVLGKNCVTVLSE
ncbi:MAG: hypothetical protein ABI367_04260 [Mucilaginibacter sp.]